MFIYKITNLVNGKVYVGQTVQAIENRWKFHQSKWARCTALKAAITKYGTENFKVEEIDGANSLDELNYREWLWICRLDCLAPNGYNLKGGGNQPRLSQQSREKSSISHMGQKAWNKGLTKEDPRVAKYVRSGEKCHTFGKGYRKGKKASLETRKRISEVQVGRKASEETRSKMSLAHLKSPKVNRKPIICMQNKIVYTSLSAAAKDLGLSVSNICNVLKGKKKSTCGYVFEYVGS